MFYFQSKQHPKTAAVLVRYALDRWQARCLRADNTSVIVAYLDKNQPPSLGTTSSSCQEQVNSTTNTANTPVSFSLGSDSEENLSDVDCSDEDLDLGSGDDEGSHLQMASLHRTGSSSSATFTNIMCRGQTLLDRSSPCNGSSSTLHRVDSTQIVLEKKPVLSSNRPVKLNVKVPVVKHWKQPKSPVKSKSPQMKRPSPTKSERMPTRSSPNKCDVSSVSSDATPTPDSHSPTSDKTTEPCSRSSDIPAVLDLPSSQSLDTPDVLDLQSESSDASTVLDPPFQSTDTPAVLDPRSHSSYTKAVLDPHLNRSDTKAVLDPYINNSPRQEAASGQSLPKPWLLQKTVYLKAEHSGAGRKVGLNLTNGQTDGLSPIWPCHLDVTDDNSSSTADHHPPVAVTIKRTGRRVAKGLLKLLGRHGSQNRAPPAPRSAPVTRRGLKRKASDEEITASQSPSKKRSLITKTAAPSSPSKRTSLLAHTRSKANK